MAGDAEQVSTSILQGAVRAGVDTCVYLPDSVLTPIVRAFRGNQSITMISCAREDEGVATHTAAQIGDACGAFEAFCAVGGDEFARGLLRGGAVAEQLAAIGKLCGGGATTEGQRQSGADVVRLVGLA